MERITYRKTLDVHKNGAQFLLQGFQTADKLSRVIEISLMASGDAIDFPLERLVAVMYVTSPGATEPSINECTIEDNKVVYEVLPIATEGITKMQLKLIAARPKGAKCVLASPEFSVEVTDSGMNDEGEELKTTFTAFEKLVADAKIAYDERFLRMELTSDCMFRAYYADGSIYETDVLQRLFRNGNVLLSESFARGGTGVRAGEDTDNSMYYSNISKSEALNAKSIMEDSEKILEEVKLHGIYTAFSIDFDTGKIVYASPQYDFEVDQETGHLKAIGKAYSMEDNLVLLAKEWLRGQGVEFPAFKNTVDKNTDNIVDLNETNKEIFQNIKELEDNIYTKSEVLTTDTRKLLHLNEDDVPDSALISLNSKLSAIPGFLTFIIAHDANVERGTLLDAAFGKNNEDFMLGIGYQMAMYAWLKGLDKTEYPFTKLLKMQTLNDMNLDVYNEIISDENLYLYTIICESPYAIGKVFDCYGASWKSDGNYDPSGASEEHIITKQITVTEGNLLAPFMLELSFSGWANINRGVIYLNDVEVGSYRYSEDGENKTFRGLKNWSDYSITDPGTYDIKMELTESWNNNEISGSMAIRCAKEY